MLHDAPPPIEVDALEIARLAAEAGVDKRTIRRRLRGEPVRGLAAARADRAIAKLRGAAVNPNAGPDAG